MIGPDLVIDRDRVTLFGEVVPRPVWVSVSAWTDYWAAARDIEHWNRQEIAFALQTDGICPCCGTDVHALAEPKPSVCEECGEPGE